MSISEQDSFETKELGKLFIYALSMGSFTKLSEKFVLNNPPVCRQTFLDTVSGFKFAL